MDPGNRLTGSATYTCNKCGSINTLNDNDFDFEEVEKSKRELGTQIEYSSRMAVKCVSCGEEAEMVFYVWEYPANAVGDSDVVVRGSASVVGHEFKIQN